ncbi:MAG: DNA primase [Burkholderiaceae bacterium]|nr:DNA primase [Burkholderiaceae bacterium]
MIPQPFIDDLLARTDIADVVGRYVKLRRAGANLLGLCPFHGEKSPSFTVSPTKQFYHCFGCGAHGSAIGFLMDHAGLGFVDAVAELAQQAGVDVPRERDDEPQRRRDPGVLESLAAAARFYKRRLVDSQRAIDYLKARGLSGATAARFAIGYAPEGWRPLEGAVADYGASALLGAGLVIEPDAEDGQAPTAERRKRYDRFRDRIMFPIRNPRGQVIGFGGRILDRGEPKYLNSPETEVFSKGRELYGLYEARDVLRREGCAIVVEGYMDVVMLAEHGVGNAVATLGTATTGDHVRKLLRLVDRVVFAFDGDAAGRKAAWRALQNCLPHANDIKRIDFMFLPAEHDPDSFVREHGADGFAAAVAAATPLSAYMLQALRDGNDLDTAEGRARMLAQAVPLLEALGAPGLRLQIGHALAAAAGIGREELDAYLEIAAQRNETRTARAGDTPGRGGRGGTPADWTRDDASGYGGGPAPGPDDGWSGGRREGSAGGSGRGSFRGSGGGDRRGGKGREYGAGAPLRPRAPVRRPDLERRLRLLAARHPALAVEAGTASWLPAGLAAWFAELARLPAGADFEAACMALAAIAPEDVERVRGDAARDPVAIARLGEDEAVAEMRDALAQLRQRDLRAQIDALVGAGLETEADRLKYQELMALARQT